MFTAQEFQTASFFGLVALFEVLERVRPAHEVNRWKDLKIDVLSFALALVLNLSCKAAVFAMVLAVTPQWMSLQLAALLGRQTTDSLHLHPRCAQPAQQGRVGRGAFRAAATHRTPVRRHLQPGAHREGAR